MNLCNHKQSQGKMNGMCLKLFLVSGMTLLSSVLTAQSLDQAKKLYNEGKFEEAKPAFEKLVERTPGNSSYNQWYGVCLYETGEKEKAEKYLRVAAKRNVQEAFRYLGELCYDTYRFEESEEMFQEYIDLLAKKKQDTLPWEQRLEQVKNALRMMEKTEDVEIIDSLVVDKEAFLTAYKLSEESGSLMLFSDFFQLSDASESTVYMNQKQDKIFYAQKTPENQFCLFTQSKLMDKWGDKKMLPMTINSANNENYPFVMSDGVTIYYASTGNGTLGGYDLFVTRYNISSDSYLVPEQLGMPFNSPSNDYMMVIDESKELGWFVSDRFQPEGKVCVYLFIPNPDRKRLLTDDLELKRSRAAIYSIKDSWKASANYKELIELAHKEIRSGVSEVKKDFEFVIVDQVVYFSLDDFQSPEARSYYEKASALNRQIVEESEKLLSLRKSYVEGDKATKERLSGSILTLEKQLENMINEPLVLEKKARNAEVNFLRNKR